MLKKTILVIAFLLIAATISMLSLFYYLGSDYILQKVETYLNQQFHGEVNVQRITLNVWQTEINFHHVRLKSLNKQPLAGCQTLCLKLAISSLWSDKIQIKQLHMIRPFLYLPIQGDNPLDFQQVMPFFSIIDHLMTKRIFSLKQAKRTKSLFLQSLNVSDAALFFAQSASDNAFRITHFFLDASQDTLDISGQLSYEGDLIPEMKVLKFQTNGTYPQNNLAQSIITLFSSHSPELFFDRFQDLFQKLRFQSQGKIDLTNDFFQHIPTIANKISGRITGEFNINALADAPKMQLSLDYSGEHLNNIPIKKISLTANASDRLITVNAIKMKMPESQVNIQGIIDLSQIISQGILTDKKNWQNVSYHFIADAKNFPIRHFHSKIPAWSRVNGHVKIKGQGADCESFQWDIHADGSTQVSQQFHISPDIPVTFQIDAQGVPNMLTVRSLTAQTQGMNLTAHGHINKNMMGSLWINTAVSGKGLSVIGLPEIAANCKTGLTIHRNTTETKANLQLNARKIVFKNYPVGSLLVNASFSQPGQITIHDALLAQGTSKISTSGFVTWDNILHWETSPQAYEISINSNDIQMNDWHPAISGTLRVHGLLAGTNQKSAGQIFLDGNALSILGQRIQSIHFPIHVKLNDIQMDAGNIQLSENEAFDISFLLNRQGHYQVDIDSDPIALSRIKWSIPEFQGNFHVNIHGNGHVNQPNINGKLIVSPLLFQNRPLPDAVFQIKTDKEILVIDCQAMLDFHAAYHMKKRTIEILAQARKMKLAPVFSCYGLTDLNGQISGDLKIAGPLQDIMNAHSQLHIDHLALTYQQIPMAWMDNFNLSIVDKELVTSDYIIHLPDKGYCRGAISGKLPQQTHIQLQSNIPLSVVGILSDNITEIQGHLLINGKVHHLLTKPMFEGQIKLSKGAFIIPWNNQRCHHIQGQLDANNHIFALKKLSFSVDDGKCDLSGKIILANGKPAQINIKASASAIPVYMPDMAQFLVNARLIYNKRNRQTSLKGNLELLEGLYYQDLSINQMLLEQLQQTRRLGMVDQICQFMPFVCCTELDIDIQSRLPIIADNDLTYMEIYPDLNIRGTIFNPVILGRTEMVNGEINYLGKTFVLEKGQVDFVNPYRTEPMIDIESNVDVRDWQISMDVQGKLNELQVKLSSTPTEEHADILSILLFGKPTHNLFVADTGPYKSTQQMIAELLSSAFEDDIKSTTGLDTFRLEALEHETTEDNQNDDYKITLGKELSRRMSVTYAFETRKGQLIHHTHANYKILENLIIRGMQDTQGTYGGELLLRMEFREISPWGRTRPGN